MSEADNLETKQQRELYAFGCKQEREKLLASVSYPKRKTIEMNSLVKSLKAGHELLQIFDVMVQAPPLADLVKNTFNETVAHLNALCTPAAK